MCNSFGNRIRHLGATAKWVNPACTSGDTIILRDDLLWSFLSLQELGQGISKGFQHSQMGGLEGDMVGIRLWKVRFPETQPLRLDMPNHSSWGMWKEVREGVPREEERRWTLTWMQAAKAGTMPCGRSCLLTASLSTIRFPSVYRQSS